jgi:hypothetical protein
MTARSPQTRTGTRLVVPTSARTLLAPGSPHGSVPGAMKKRPPGGITARPMRDRYPLAGVTWRLLDSRVLAAAAAIVDVDVARPLVEWLSTYERVVAAARATTAHPTTVEKVEIVAKGWTWRHSEELTVTVTVEQDFRATFEFRLDLTATLGETSVVVRAGAVREVVVDVLTVSGKLHLGGWPSPIWDPEPAELPTVNLAVQPPFRVPIPPVPVPRVPSAAARTGPPSGVVDVATARGPVRIRRPAP